jgi:hypothetical protein
MEPWASASGLLGDEAGTCPQDFEETAMSVRLGLVALLAIVLVMPAQTAMADGGA